MTYPTGRFTVICLAAMLGFCYGMVAMGIFVKAWVRKHGMPTTRGEINRTT